MGYDIDDFLKGDLVKYISECHDHDEALDRYSIDDFYEGGYYTILDVDIRGNNVLLDLGEDDWGDEMSWWVHIDHLQPTKDVGDKNHPYYKVIRKIKQMDLRRKEKGYAF